MREKQRVLVVDDDAKLGDLIRLMLAPTYETRVLDNAQAALRVIAAGERLDIILCDLMLPGLNMDFAQVWRAGGLRRGLSSLSYLL